MSPLSLEDFDKHIANLRLQLQFLNEALEATDHKAPDWLATDLVSLRNKSGRLQDDMQSFRDRVESEGYGTRKSSNKRLSLEGVKPSRSTAVDASPNPLTSPALSQNARPSPRQPQSEDSYVAQHIDVTEEVNRRLHESRLRRLMDSPSTSQKRKRDAFEDMRMGSGGDIEDDTEDTLDTIRTPRKKLRASGSFEPVLKRKANGLAGGAFDNRGVERSDFKKRKIWPDTT